MSNIWKQELAGKYVSDDKEINVTWDYPSLSLLVTDHQTFWEYFDNMESLAIYLNNIGLPPLIMIMRSDLCEWKVYDDFKPFEVNPDVTKKIWYKITDEKNIMVLMLLKLNSGYSLQLWDSGFRYPMHFETKMLGYVESYEKNPETDYQVAVSEAMSHGSSGMDKSWHNLTIPMIVSTLKEIGIADDVKEV